MSEKASTKAAYIIGFMIALAALFGGGVTGIYLGSAKTLERNSSLAWQRSLVSVFDLGNPDQLSKREIAELVNTHVVAGQTVTDPQTGEELELVKAYADEEHTQLLAYGLRFRGLGFWAPIEGILAVTPDGTETIGLVVLEQAETPGLGGRIEEPVFTRQFEEGVVISPNPDGAFIRVEAPGTPDSDGRQVDAITGATQTSVAMERILNQNLQKFHRAMDFTEHTK